MAQKGNMTLTNMVYGLGAAIVIIGLHGQIDLL